MKNIISLIFLLSLSVSVSAQQERLISGIVYDKSTMNVLPGVNIRVNSSNLGAVTMNNGKFVYTLKLNNIPLAVLEISCIGYKKQIITIGEKNYFTIYLEEENLKLDEVVVTSSYGTKKLREEVVGSITSIKASDLQVAQAAESFDRMLEGAAAGVLITGNSALGSPIKIDIRGQGSLTPINGSLIGTSTQPLIIIDGIIMTEESGFDNEQFDGKGVLSEQFKNPLSKIAPEDIEEITILKDAAAVGIYGADAANGVVLVTTKKSRTKKLLLNFSNQIGFSKPINKIKYLSGPQYHDILKELFMNQGESLQQATASAGSSIINTNWFDLLNRDSFFRRYNFDASFGTHNWSFRASLNSTDTDEPQIGNNFQRYAGNININYNSTKLSAQLSLSPSLVNQNEPNTFYSFPLPSNIAPLNENGAFNDLGIQGFGNPLAVAAQNINNSKVKGLLTSINLTYTISNRWNINSLFGIDYSNKQQERYFSGYNESGQLNGTFKLDNADGTTTTFPNWGRRLDYSRKSYRWNQSTRLAYNTKIDNHSFDGLIGLELQKEKIDNSRQLGTGFIDPGPVNNALDAKGSIILSGLVSETKRRSVFSQFNYNYDKKYFALLTVRRDESSAFGKDNDQTYNGGIGASWNISNENFLKYNQHIDFLRLRISYGLTGNSRIGSYRALGLYDLTNDGFSGYNEGGYAVPRTSPNPFLTWEKNYKFNIGLDFNFLRKAKFTLEYFNDDIEGLIATRNVPLETGFSTIQINGADMFNRGVEFTAKFDWFNTNNFKWVTNFNISTLKNRVTALKGLGTAFSISEVARAQRVGAPTSAIWGVRYAGVDQATGRELFKKDGQIYDAATYARLFNENDWEIIGDSQPDFFGGIQNSFIFFNNLTLSIRASYRYGDDILIDDELESQYRIIINRNVSVNVLDRWQNPGDIAQHPRVTRNNPIIPNSSKFIYDASHIKIQNINLSYVLPLNKMNTKVFNRISVFSDISNVAYFYKEKSLRGRNGIAEYRYAYPESQTVTFGITANF